MHANVNTTPNATSTPHQNRSPHTNEMEFQSTTPSIHPRLNPPLNLNSNPNASIQMKYEINEMNPMEQYIPSSEHGNEHDVSHSNSTSTSRCVSPDAVPPLSPSISICPSLQLTTPTDTPPDTPAHNSFSYSHNQPMKFDLNEFTNSMCKLSNEQNEQSNGNTKPHENKEKLKVKQTKEIEI
jgi:hypothetical protein